MRNKPPPPLKDRDQHPDEFSTERDPETSRKSRTTVCNQRQHLQLLPALRDNVAAAPPQSSRLTPSLRFPPQDDIQHLWTARFTRSRQRLKAMQPSSDCFPWKKKTALEEKLLSGVHRLAEVLPHLTVNRDSSVSDSFSSRGLCGGDKKYTSSQSVQVPAERAHRESLD